MAAACGGADETQPPAQQQTQPRSEAATTARRQPDEAVTAARASVAQVQLGDRFEWCAELQTIWADDHAARVRVGQAIDTAAAALNAWQVATDELDKAEAAAALDVASTAAAGTAAAAEAAIWQAATLLPIAEEYHRASANSPEGVAFARSWQAFADTADDTYWDAVAAVEAAAEAETLARRQASLLRQDIEDRRSEYAESTLYESAEIAEARINHFARVNARLEQLGPGFEPLHPAFYFALDGLYKLGDSFEHFTNNRVVSSRSLIDALEDIRPVVNAARDATQAVRGSVEEDRLEEFDELVVLFEEANDLFVESYEAFAEAVNARDAGLAGLEDEHYAADAAVTAAVEARNAATDTLRQTQLEVVSHPAYAAFKESFRESCA